MASHDNRFAAPSRLSPAPSALALGAIAFGAALAGCGGGYGNKDSSGNGLAYSAFRQGQSHVPVVVTGSISKDLGIETGARGRFQDFLLHLTGGPSHGLTVRVNADITRSQPLQFKTGQTATVSGYYVYNADGGMINDVLPDPSRPSNTGYVKFQNDGDPANGGTAH